MNRVFTAYMTKVEYDGLCRECRSDLDLLASKARFFGRTVEIHFTRDLEELASDTLMDRLYWMANRISEEKFISYYHQVNEIVGLPRSRLKSILEIGPGAGIFRSLLGNYGYDVKTLDIVTVNGADVVGDVRRLPVRRKSCDMAVCFEVLEHLPYEGFKTALAELSGAANNYVFLSLPYQCNGIYLEFRSRIIERFMSRLTRNFVLSLQFKAFQKDIDEAALLTRKIKHHAHYWEIGRKSYPIGRIVSDIESSGLTVLKKFHSPRKPYHYFILCGVDSKSKTPTKAEKR